MGLNKLLMSYNKCRATKICWLLWSYRKADDSVKTEQPDRISLVLLNDLKEYIRLAGAFCHQSYFLRSALHLSAGGPFLWAKQGCSPLLPQTHLSDWWSAEQEEESHCYKNFSTEKDVTGAPWKGFVSKLLFTSMAFRIQMTACHVEKMSPRDAGARCPTLVNYSNWGGNKTSAVQVILMRKKISLPRCIMKIHSPTLLYQCNSHLHSGLII